ncbi:MAG TPA: DUF4845 domain-containing protein [Gammaproteobacteria bacterium]|nr:DUF4845 domain-containing protein [Gammaproteobacteria bacterium]
MNKIRQSQQGLGVWSVLAWVAVIGVMFWIGARIVPLYYEYWSIKTVFQEQIQKGSLYSSTQGLKKEVLKELHFQDLDRLGSKDLHVEKGPRGDRYHISAKYEANVPLARGVRLVLTFQPEATEGG